VVFFGTSTTPVFNSFYDIVWYPITLALTDVFQILLLAGVRSTRTLCSLLSIWHKELFSVHRLAFIYFVHRLRMTNGTNKFPGILPLPPVRVTATRTSKKGYLFSGISSRTFSVHV
jgi:hypothetical protein